ncbi:unnamed protein product, partial [Meganyctiphanes norvegica]
QVWFLILVFFENLILILIGIQGLDESYDRNFIIIVTVLCLLGFLFGVILQIVHYRSGHLWADINGPKVNCNEGKVTLHLPKHNQKDMDRQWTEWSMRLYSPVPQNDNEN